MNGTTLRPLAWLLLVLLLFDIRFTTTSLAHDQAVDIEPVPTHEKGQSASTKIVASKLMRQESVKGNVALEIPSKASIVKRKMLLQVRNKRHFAEENSESITSSFVAFSADYHAPRHHTPTNN